MSRLAFDTLRHHYANRLEAAREAHAGGARVIGMVGNTIPRELVLATGYFPVVIAAESRGPTPAADVYMEDVIPPETKALFELTMSGALDFVDLLVLSRPYAQLYYYLKEVYRLGRAPRLPPLHMFDLMHSRRDAVRAYNWCELDALRERLEHLSGGSITDSDLHGAIQLTNSVRAAQHALLDTRWRRMVSGTDALQAVGAGYFMSPTTYQRALREYVAGLKPDAELEDRVRVLVMSAEPLSNLRLHTALERAGALVVAEDDAWGSRAPGGDISTNGFAMQAIFDKYWHDTATPCVTPAEVREAWFREHAVRDDVDAVVLYLPPSDRQVGWDYPRLKSWLDEHGKPSLRLRRDVADTDGAARIQTEASEWIASL